jgi:hypothetical protein
MDAALRIAMFRLSIALLIKYSPIATARPSRVALNPIIREWVVLIFELLRMLAADAETMPRGYRYVRGPYTDDGVREK